MSEQDRNLKETKKDLIDIENGLAINPQIKLLMKLIAIVFLLLATLIILICMGLLLQSYFKNHIVYEEIIFDIFDIKFGIQQFYYSCFKTIGYLLLIIIMMISIISPLRLKKIKYILFINSNIFMFLYFATFFNYSQLNLKWWKYLIELFLIISCSSLCLFTTLIKKQNFYDFSRLVAFISFIISAINN